MKISRLPEEYRLLAERRREESSWSVDNTEDELSIAFDWSDTPEETIFWSDVNNGEFPEIPVDDEIYIK